MIALALLVIAAKLVLDGGRPRRDGSAFAQAVTSGGARGMFAFSGQLSKGTYGIYMIDVDAMTTWVYEYLPQKGCLRLAASRTWRYDRYLEDFNTCGPPPDDVRRMVDEQRQYRLRSAQQEEP